VEVFRDFENSVNTHSFDRIPLLKTTTMASQASDSLSTLDNSQFDAGSSQIEGSFINTTVLPALISEASPTIKIVKRTAESGITLDIARMRLFMTLIWCRKYCTTVYKDTGGTGNASRHLSRKYALELPI
jgi:hypothetical protein